MNPRTEKYLAWHRAYYRRTVADLRELMAKKGWRYSYSAGAWVPLRAAGGRAAVTTRKGGEMSDTVSEQTRQYWIDTLMGWAESRLAAPQFDECKRAMAQTEAQHGCADLLAQAEAERDEYGINIGLRAELAAVYDQLAAVRQSEQAERERAQKLAALLTQAQQFVNTTDDMNPQEYDECIVVYNAIAAALSPAAAAPGAGELGG